MTPDTPTGTTTATTPSPTADRLVERAATGELLGPALSVDAPSVDAVARELGVSSDAVALVRSSEVVDLHLDTFIWTRVFGYDFGRRHGNGPLDARYFSQTDVPRICDANLTSAVWSITTNPFRPMRNRAVTFHKNLARLRRLLRDDPRTEHVRTLTEYAAARAQGRHAALIGVQGGNALDSDPDLVRAIPDDSVVKITVLHLKSSTLGRTSTPEPWRAGASTQLTAKGREFVAACDDARVLVDLAHIHPDSFWDAVDVHDPSLPFIVSHTGVDGVTLHWRNLDDDQLIAVARSGGTVGIMFECGFVGADRRVEPHRVVD